MRSAERGLIRAIAAVVEWLWHVDDRDHAIGRVERDEAHDRGLRHRSGIVFLLDAEQRAYLVVRAASKRIFPGRYDTSASFHVGYPESYAAAAHREAFEELGLDKQLIEIGKFRHDDPPEHQFVGVFVMEHAGEPIVLDPSEAARGEFYRLEDAELIVRDEPCTPWLRDGIALLVAYVRGA